MGGAMAHNIGDIVSTKITEIQLKFMSIKWMKCVSNAMIIWPCYTKGEILQPPYPLGNYIKDASFQECDGYVMAG